MACEFLLWDVTLFM